MNSPLLDDHISPRFQAADTGRQNRRDTSSKSLPEMKQQSSPQATAVPNDIIEEILLHLPSQDILRMKQVRWDGGYVNS